MKKADVKVGDLYIVKVAGRMAPVRIVGLNPHGGWDGKNVLTGHAVRIRSAQRLRYPARMPVETESAAIGGKSA